MTDIGHNSGGMAGAELLQFVERVERLEEEIRELNGDKSDVYKEARGRGFDVATMRKVVARRKLDPAERQEADAMLELYLDGIAKAEAEKADDPRVHVHGAPTRTRGAPIQDPAARSAGATGDDDPSAEPAAPVATHSPEQGSTHAPPETPPATQDEARTDHGRKGAVDPTGRDQGAHEPVETAQFVTDAGAGEGVAAPVDPAPAPDDRPISRFRPTANDLFLNPAHTMSARMREAICQQFSVPDAAFDAFRTEMIAGHPAPVALDLALQSIGGA